MEMWDAYAWALHVNGRDAEALEAIQEALALGTRSARFHYHAGMIYLSLGHTAEAVEHLTTALAINPYFDLVAAGTARAALAEVTG